MPWDASNSNECCPEGNTAQKFNAMPIKTNQNSGFTLVEIMIVVAIIGLLVALAIPNIVKARENAQLTSILNNLRTLEGAKDAWALENKQGTGTATSLAAISDYLKGGSLKPVINETYDATVVGSPSTATLPARVRLGSYTGGSTISSP